MKTVLVTGAAGMIGKACIELLVQKKLAIIGTDNAPKPLDAENFTYVEANITDKDAITNILEKNKPDVLVHLACSVDNDFPETLSSNEEKISATVDKYLFKAAVAAGVKDIILLSTHQIYATPKTREPIREGSPEKASSTYAKIKSSSEDALNSALKKTATTNGVIMRTCPIYTKDFIDNLKSKIFDPKDNCAFVYGYGDYSFSFTCLYNIPDFIYGILTVAENINYEGVYNVCDTKQIAAKDIVETLRADHRIGVVMQRTYGSEAIKSAAALFGAKSAKSDYRYNDLSIVCSNIAYDNTRAQRISSFRWKFSNTK